MLDVSVGKCHVVASLYVEELLNVSEAERNVKIRMWFQKDSGRGFVLTALILRDSSDKDTDKEQAQDGTILQRRRPVA
jgi:hypothetical protein